MQGDIVAASKWLGASMILASGLLVGGLHWVLSTNVNRLVRLTTERSPEVVSLAGETAVLPRPDQDLAARDIHALVEQFRRDSNVLRVQGDQAGPLGLRAQASDSQAPRTSSR
jgi:hypothetical protein